MKAPLAPSTWMTTLQPLAALTSETMASMPLTSSNSPVNWQVIWEWGVSGCRGRNGVCT